MLTFLLTVHFIVTLALVGAILLQKSETGAWGMGGGSGGVLSPRGQSNLLTHITAVLAGLFIFNCLVMAVLVKNETRRGSLIDELPTVNQSAPIPAQPLNQKNN